jgi:hypothetical protein
MRPFEFNLLWGCTRDVRNTISSFDRLTAMVDVNKLSIHHPFRPTSCGSFCRQTRIARRSLVQRLLNDPELLVLQEKHRSDRPALLQVRDHADRTEASGLNDRLVDRIFKRGFRFGHRRGL